jgi:hypothetical protein
MAADGALRCDQPGRVQAAQEGGRDAQDFRGSAHAVGGMVVVIELLTGVWPSVPAGAGRTRVIGPSGNATRARCREAPAGGIRTRPDLRGAAVIADPRQQQIERLKGRPHH